mmetsp:Transcript_20921/g.47246  ORF Transcript_20921/g.47246 Transcript_20921/m.47246 type:complete len:231 (-) Transcript_20921:1141-1833(-)
MAHELGLEGREDWATSQERGHQAPNGRQASLLEHDLGGIGQHGCQHEEQVVVAEEASHRLGCQRHEGLLHFARQSKERSREAEGFGGAVDKALVDVEANVRVEHAQQLHQFQVKAEPHPLACGGLLCVTHRHFRVEGEHAHEAHVSPLAHVEILSVDRPAPAQREIKAGEDVLGEVQAPRALRHTALLHHLQLVHEIRVPVVETRVQGPVQRSLDHGPKSELAVRSNPAQ